ncbi:hypothetical protein ACFQBQ_12670 [Granulicella cerasi]|uniref:TonB-dependent transporter Oar-like beta-barrel domain-containing protein n=1 Tax=Granulicella cerasi TaxID=741063 RepID=A0ABW1ZAF6_9BACT
MAVLPRQHPGSGGRRGAQPCLVCGQRHPLDGGGKREFHRRGRRCRSGRCGGLAARGEHLHGRLFAIALDAAFAATNPYSVATRYNNGSPITSLVKPRAATVEVGGSVGGPLAFRGAPHWWRTHAAGIASLEYELRDTRVVASSQSPSFFTLSATQQALLANRGVTAVQRAQALRFLDSLMGETTRDSTRLLSFARLDLKPTMSDSLALAFLGNRFASPVGASFAGRSDAVMTRGVGSLGDARTEVTAFTASWTRTLPHGWTNDLRAQWSHDLEFEQPRAPLAQEPAVASGGLSPQVTIAPEGFVYGTPASLGRTAYPDEHRVQLVETASWLHRGVFLRLGANWSRVQDRIDSATNTNGTFRYSSGDTNGRAGGLVDWMTDYIYGVNAYPNAACPSITASVHRFCFLSYTQTFGAQQTEFATHEIAGFAQAEWSAWQRLHFTLGLRGEYTLLPLPQRSNPALNLALRSLNDPRAGSTAVFPEDRNNFGPRVSVAWRAPLGITATAGYGLFFGRLAGETTRAALTENALATGIERVRITPRTEVLCPQTPTVSFGYPCSFTGAAPSAVAETARALVFAPHFRLPAVQRFSLTLQREIARGWQAHVAYAGALATQLPGTVDLNVQPSTTLTTFQLQGGVNRLGARAGTTFSVPLYSARKLNGYGPLTALLSDDNATFHALDASLRGRWRTLQLQRPTHGRAPSTTLRCRAPLRIRTRSSTRLRTVTTKAARRSTTRTTSSAPCSGGRRLQGARCGNALPSAIGPSARRGLRAAAHRSA